VSIFSSIQTVKHLLVLILQPHPVPTTSLIASTPRRMVPSHV